MWDRRAQLVRVLDGDTVEVVLDQGFGDTKTIDIRLFGVWAPEMKAPGGTETRDFVKRWFYSLPLTKWNFVVTTIRMASTDREQKTFDRYVATITSLDGSRSLNAEVTQFVQEKGYGGGTGS
jgi:endonuclease YncB( thermonuclease family)